MIFSIHPGYFLLLLSILCYCASILCWRSRISKHLYIAGSSLTIISFLLLEYAFIVSDFSVQNVFFNSSTLMPLVYKISSAWSSHEGSMLLWLAMLSMIGILFTIKLSSVLDKLCCSITIGLDRDLLLEHNRSIVSRTINISAFIQLMFCSFIACSSNPFVFFANNVNEGLGLNPTLQDVGLAIHPPILYLGYTSLYGCFLSILCIIVNCQYLVVDRRLTKPHPSNKISEDFGAHHRNIFNINEDSSTKHPKQLPAEVGFPNEANDKILCQQKCQLVGKVSAMAKFQNSLFRVSSFFVSIALAALTCGIGLGGWWAYRELGWGGYWFFDPVENISLLPWISGLIMHHSLIVVLKTGRLKKTASLFGLLSFIITLYGFFLVRGGIITSVHSFAFSPERGWYIMAICVIITLSSLSLYVIKKRYLVTEDDAISYQSEKMSRDLIPPMATGYRLMYFGNVIWIFALLILIVAIIYPIYYSMLWGVDIAIDPSYFYRIFLPIFVPIFFLAGSAPFVLKKHTSSKSKQTIDRDLIAPPRIAEAKINLLKILFLSCIFASPIIIFIVSAENNKGLINKSVTSFVIIAAIYLMNSSIYSFKKNIDKSMLGISGKSISLFLGHFGVGLLALSIAVNIYCSSDLEFVGHKGEWGSNGDLSVALTDIKFAESPSYYRQIAVFYVQTHNDKVTLKPENRFYKIEKRLSQEVDIYSCITHDLYAVLSQIDHEVISASISYKPMMSFIWISLLLISLGFVLPRIKR